MFLSLVVPRGQNQVVEVESRLGAVREASAANSAEAEKVSLQLSRIQNECTALEATTASLDREVIVHVLNLKLTSFLFVLVEAPRGGGNMLSDKRTSSYFQHREIEWHWARLWVYSNRVDFKPLLCKIDQVTRMFG